MHSGIKKFGFLMSLLSAESGCRRPKPPSAPSNATTSLQFVQNYITQLATFEDLRDDAAKELDADKTHAPMACIHSGERYNLEIAAAIRMLRSSA